MTTRFDHQLAEIRAAMQQGSDRHFFQALRALASDTEDLSDEESTTLVQKIAPMLPGLVGTFAKLAIVAGAMVERGASPMSLAEVLPERVLMTMASYLTLERIWDRAAQGRPLPEFTPPLDQMLLHEIEETVAVYVRRSGQSEQAEQSGRRIAQIAYSWFSLEDWINPLISAMTSSREFRDAMAWREDIADGAGRLKHRSERAYWLHGLCLVRDDEPLIVLDPTTGRGFRLTMSGVGDNYQLHTLLADRLIRPEHGGLLDTQPPEPAWVEAATTASPGPFDVTNPIMRRFRLFDGHGGYVYPEGRPADIEPLDGVRVLVLHPPNGNYGWSNGRAYASMVPTLTLDREIEPAEAAQWLSRIAPARETDMMARSPR
ncbi:hypothetical protein KDK95_02285 [Actinospica sp. MGRD01-02]|uniref:Uncharacterized protein n=1 Tax=Actinospica acidithermotolerans TaxID=2828514 RepID=A0A941IFJ6_9ACTN|nr:hypothetical protein [Actinospica acidithermotolerans]MBR7825119.1 hypothetical protein [Actinospica acidithermotolerans]